MLIIYIVLLLLFCSCDKTEPDVTQLIYEEIPDTTTTVLTSEYSDVVGKSNRSLFSKTQVLLMYKQAVDLVKLRCPGFTRTIENDIYEIGTCGKSASFLDTITKTLVADDRSADSCVQVEPDDDLSCRIFFPVYDTDYGCRIYDGASVADAFCYDDGYAYDVYIVFHEQNTNDGLSPEFAQMMTPFPPETLMLNLNAYFPALSEQNCNVYLRYYNCEIRCRIDKSTGHLLSLSQKMVTQIDMDVTFDFVLTESNFSAQATMVNHLDFSDFKWH